MNIAPNTVEINGITYNKCHLSDKQWDDCITPCAYCQLQAQCTSNDTVCRDTEERICYINLGAIYGEE